MRITMVNNVNKLNIFGLFKKLTCNPGTLRANPLLSPFELIGALQLCTLIMRNSTIRTKHESTTRKGTKYTVKKDKLTFWFAFFQPCSTFAIRQHGRTVVAENAGSVYSSRALPARVGVVIIHYPYSARDCVWMGALGGRGLLPRRIGWGSRACFPKPLLY